MDNQLLIETIVTTNEQYALAKNDYTDSFIDSLEKHVRDNNLMLNVFSFNDRKLKGSFVTILCKQNHTMYEIVKTTGIATMHNDILYDLSYQFVYNFITDQLINKNMLICIIEKPIADKFSKIYVYKLDGISIAQYDSEGILNVFNALNIEIKNNFIFCGDEDNDIICGFDLN